MAAPAPDRTKPYGATPNRTVQHPHRNKRSLLPPAYPKCTTVVAAAPDACPSRLPNVVPMPLLAFSRLVCRHLAPALSRFADPGVRTDLRQIRE
ncbi:DNA helicase UvrD [Anopheles sinensis]|uniref:DNA helicase UvrD n=1 Tax=Anopheles sinensis TaxID=74873 RepID=A0A084VIX9_ANOSI|nr:DNA helicase UvrD [Anopheles sinensis]